MWWIQKHLIVSRFEGLWVNYGNPNFLFQSLESHRLGHKGNRRRSEKELWRCTSLVRACRRILSARNSMYVFVIAIVFFDITICCNLSTFFCRWDAKRETKRKHQTEMRAVLGKSWKTERIFKERQKEDPCQRRRIQVIPFLFIPFLDSERMYFNWIIIPEMAIRRTEMVIVMKKVTIRKRRSYSHG